MEKYKCVRQLGRGSYGPVWLVRRNEDKKVFAMKEITIKSEEDKKSLKKRLEILSQLEHPNIIKYENHFEKDDKIFVVLEYADRGNLDQYVQENKSTQSQKHLGNLTEGDILGYFCQICLAVDYLRSKNMYYYIKCSKVLLDYYGNAKLECFGIDKEGAMIPNGSSHYFPPEIYNKKPYSHKSDIWGLGVLLYYLAMAKYPFEGMNSENVRAKVIKGVFEPLPRANNDNSPRNGDKGFSKGFISLVNRCLDVNTNNRYDIEEVLSTSVVQTALRSSNRVPEKRDKIPIADEGKYKYARLDNESEENILIKRLLQTLEDKEMESNALKSKLNILHGDLEKIKEEKDRYKTIIEEKDRKVITLQETIEDLKRRSQELDKESIKLKEVYNASCEELKRVQNEKINVPPSTVKEFSELCSLSKHALRKIVTEINFNFKYITKENTYEMFNSLFPYCMKLSILRLGGNKNIGDEGAAALSKVLSSNLSLSERLNELDLSGDNISNQGATAIAAVLPYLKSLTGLYLYKNNFGDEGTKALIIALTHLKCLTRLDLDRNKIGDEGAMALANALPRFTKLNTLHLYGNKITDNGKAKVNGVTSAYSTKLHICWNNWRD